jgi:hypothetical protein
LSPGRKEYFVGVEEECGLERYDGMTWLGKIEGN